ncbi:MAG: glutamine synthetase family protein [Clostridia bacterium]|nr:glutamine synthetase family protein [Clostridia bacterium]
MKYTKDEVLQFVAEEDVKFIRMAFCDVYGKPKNISIMADELPHAFAYGVAIDGSAIAGFGRDVHSDLLLHPDPATLSLLPWRPDQGRVVRMFCTVTHPDGTPFEADTRSLLQDAVTEAEQAGITFAFGSEMEFYLFKRDENGEPTRIPYDQAGYMDIAPEDKGENVRREICLTLEQMGIHPESSHHEEGPGQNEIDFRYSEPMSAADNAITFKTVVNTVAARNGLCADFSPKPMDELAGNGMHINISAKAKDGRDVLPQVIAGIMAHIRDITVFLNTAEASYRRLGNHKAPRFVSWSRENRSQLIRVPAADAVHRRAELRSPDPMCNPYLAYAMIIHAALDGIRRSLTPDSPCDRNLFESSDATALPMLPASLTEAKQQAARSSFVKEKLNESIWKCYV